MSNTNKRTRQRRPDHASRPNTADQRAVGAAKEDAEPGLASKVNQPDTWFWYPVEIAHQRVQLLVRALNPAHAEQQMHDLDGVEMSAKATAAPHRATPLSAINAEFKAPPVNMPPGSWIGLHQTALCDVLLAAGWTKPEIDNALSVYNELANTKERVRILEGLEKQLNARVAELERTVELRGAKLDAYQQAVRDLGASSMAGRLVSMGPFGPGVYRY